MDNPPNWLFYRYEVDSHTIIIFPLPVWSADDLCPGEQALGWNGLTLTPWRNWQSVNKTGLILKTQILLNIMRILSLNLSPPLFLLLKYFGIDLLYKNGALFSEHISKHKGEIHHWFYIILLVIHNLVAIK